MKKYNWKTMLLFWILVAVLYVVYSLFFWIDLKDLGSCFLLGLYFIVSLLCLVPVVYHVEDKKPYDRKNLPWDIFFLLLCLLCTIASFVVAILVYHENYFSSVLLVIDLFDIGLYSFRLRKVLKKGAPKKN